MFGPNMFVLNFYFDTGLNTQLSGPTSFYKFRHNQGWLVLKLKYLKGQKIIITEIFKTNMDLETSTLETLKRIHTSKTCTWVKTFTSKTMSMPCEIVFTNGMGDEKRIQISWRD